MVQPAVAVEVVEVTREPVVLETPQIQVHRKVTPEEMVRHTAAVALEVEAEVEVALLRLVPMQPLDRERKPVMAEMVQRHP
jgi:hypothetical protein